MRDCGRVARTVDRVMSASSRKTPRNFLASDHALFKALLASPTIALVASR
jgi:hypothetical protein